MKKGAKAFAIAATITASLLFSACNIKPTQTTNSQQQTAQLPAPQTTTVTLNIVNKKLTIEEPTIKLKEGEKVLLEVISDQEGELHIHGYDIILQLNPNESAKAEFTADKTGRFEFELENSGTLLGAFEVLPK